MKKHFTKEELNAFKQAKDSIQGLSSIYEGKKANESDKRIIGYAKSAASHTGQKRSQEARNAMSAAQQGKVIAEETKQMISNAMKGKTLEEMLGEERAAVGREARRQANYKTDYTGRGVKIASTRRANGSYENNGMTGKQHKEETKQAQSTKAQIRQNIKRELGLGRNDSIPKEVLEAAYKKAGIFKGKQ